MSFEIHFHKRLPKTGQLLNFLPIYLLIIKYLFRSPYPILLAIKLYLVVIQLLDNFNLYITELINFILMQFYYFRI